MEVWRGFHSIKSRALAGWTAVPSSQGHEGGGTSEAHSAMNKAHLLGEGSGGEEGLFVLSAKVVLAFLSRDWAKMIWEGSLCHKGVTFPPSRGSGLLHSPLL